MTQTKEFKQAIASQLEAQYLNTIIKLSHDGYELVFQVENVHIEDPYRHSRQIKDAKQKMTRIINAFGLKPYLSQHVVEFFSGTYGKIDEKPTKTTLPIILGRKGEERTVNVECWVYGPLAIHREYLEPITDPTHHYIKDSRKRNWVLIHVNTGRSIKSFSGRSSAIEALKRLYAVLPKEYWYFDKAEDFTPEMAQKTMEVLSYAA